MDAQVRQVFDSYPVEYREPLLEIRELVYTVAGKLPEVDGIEESLK